MLLSANIYFEVDITNKACVDFYYTVNENPRWTPVMSAMNNPRTRRAAEESIQYQSHDHVRGLNRTGPWNDFVLLLRSKL